MPEYELLELLLFNAIERIDVKPLAKALLAAFGDLNGVVAASEHRLMQVPGATPKVWLQLRVVEAFAHRMARARVIQRSVISSWDELMAYCRTVMAYRETEQFRILFLDRKNVLIADEAQAKGTVDHVPVYPREVARRALELNASALILVHNHPSGDPTPSDGRHRHDRGDRARLPGHRRRAARSRGDRQGRRGLVPQPRPALTQETVFRHRRRLSQPEKIALSSGTNMRSRGREGSCEWNGGRSGGARSPSARRLPRSGRRPPCGQRQLRVRCDRRDIAVYEELVKPWEAETGNTVTFVPMPSSTTDQFAQYKLWLAAGNADIDVYQST